MSLNSLEKLYEALYLSEHNGIDFEVEVIDTGFATGIMAITFYTCFGTKLGTIAI